MSERPYVFDGTQHDAELDRLRALEAVFDTATRGCLLGTGLGPGWRCLEVGAGAGSIAKWLSETVGQAGRVLAVDLNARFLSKMPVANLELREADVRTASIEPESIDLAHARFVLIHVPQWMEALAAVIASLKPGGWIVLEEPDFSSSRSLAGRVDLRRAFDNVHRAIEAMFRQRGMDYAFGARLPGLLQERDFESISIENDAAIVAGGSPHASMMAMSTSHLAEKYIATGLATAEDIELYGRFAADPTCWATYHATIRGVGRKPRSAAPANPGIAADVTHVTQTGKGFQDRKRVPGTVDCPPEGRHVNPFRIALANIRFPGTPEESITLARQAIDQASGDGAGIICFPECFIPGYRGMGKPVPPPNPEFLERAWSAIAEAVLGTERLVEGALVAAALVINRDGSRAGFQDKVQIDPTEEGTYTPGSGRRVFQAGPLTFGVAICHEGWRYPETVRWAARRGAHVVFHPHFHEAQPDSYRPTAFADPGNTFHEKAALCRTAENTCYFATVNYASVGSPTTSAIVRPDGTLLSYQPYGEEGLLVADIDIITATGLLAARYKPVS